MWFNANMEAKTGEAIIKKSAELHGVEQLPGWIKAIDRYSLSGQPEYFYIKDDKAFLIFLQFIGHEAVTSEQIIAYYYTAMANEAYEVYGESLHFKGDSTVVAIQDMLADSGINLEFPNDFGVNLAIALDSETMVLYRHQMSAEPHVCQDCQNSTDQNIIDDLQLNEGKYGCGHILETYDSRNDVILKQRVGSPDALNQLLHL